MSCVAWGANVAHQATAKTIADLLGITDRRFAKRMTVKNSAGSTANLLLGNADVTTSANIHIELVPGQSYDFYSGEGWNGNPAEVYAIGTVGATNYLVVNGME